MSIKAKIEAVLYLTDKPLKPQTIANLINEDLASVRQTLLNIVQEYENKDSAFEISTENGYMFQIKDEYANILNTINPIEISQAALRTLSAIAIKQPVIQSDIIKLRGSGAYEHIKELIEMDFILKQQEDGRSPLLLTSKKFQQYFKLSKDAISVRKSLKQDAKTTNDSDSTIINEIDEVKISINDTNSAEKNISINLPNNDTIQNYAIQLEG